MTKRAAYGESSIFQDNAGRWHGYVSMGTGPGDRRDRRHVSGTRRKDVVTKVRKLERRRDDGITGTPGRAPTVEAWLTVWLDTIAARKVKPYTLHNYRKMINGRIVPVLGHHRLDRLQPEHVEAFYAELEGEGLSGSTVLQCHRILSRALKVATQRGRVARNVCQLVDAPKAQRPEVVPLSTDEARTVLATAATMRNAARWSVALSLGLRQGEALGLRWQDVDLDEGTLRVVVALQRQKGRGLVFTDPKQNSKRTIALPPSMLAALKAQRLAQLEERLIAGSYWQDHGLVFAQVNGKPIDPRRDWQDWSELLVAAKVPHRRVHDARHTAATLLLVQGVDVKIVSAILGHSTARLTQDTYQHLVPELARDAAERMERALWA